MHALPRVLMSQLRKTDLPQKPGVYALYRADRALYVGLAAVVAWLDECEITWQPSASAVEAVELERNLKREWMPPFTKR